MSVYKRETYSIQKLAIQKGFVGDSTVGVIEIDGARVRKKHRAPPQQGQIE